MPRISLCVIARNEETMLPGCLASVKGVADEIVLVDTGSDDRTREIAAAAGARVFEHPWNDDFSAPRNEAIRRARGDWLLTLDADERLAPGSGPKLRAAIRRARFHVGLLPLHNASALDASPADVLSGRARSGNACAVARLLRNQHQPRFSGIIHETIEPWAHRHGMLAAHLDVPIVHYGAIEAFRVERGKNDRNLALLRRRCAEAPDDVFALGYLAGELYDRGDFEEARAAIEQGWATADRQPRSCSFLRLALQRARLALRDGDVGTALASLDLTEQRDGPSFDAAVLRGTAWDVLADRETAPEPRIRATNQAAAAYEEAIALYDVPAIMKLNGAQRFELHLLRGHSLLVAGRIEEAEREFRTAGSLEPASDLVRLGECEILLQRQDPLAALRDLEPFLAQGRRHPDGWLLAAEAARRVGAERDAALFLERVREALPSRFAARHRERRWRELSARSAPMPTAPEPAAERSPP